MHFMVPHDHAYLLQEGKQGACGAVAEVARRVLCAGKCDLRRWRRVAAQGRNSLGVIKAAPRHSNLSPGRLRDTAFVEHW